MRYGISSGLGSPNPIRLRRTPDQLGVPVDRVRTADEISLHFVAGFLRQEIQLCFGLHALGNYRHLEAAPKTDHGANDGRRLRISIEVDDEGAIDFDFVKWERLQIRQ